MTIEQLQAILEEAIVNGMTPQAEVRCVRGRLLDASAYSLVRGIAVPMNTVDGSRLYLWLSYSGYPPDEVLEELGL